MVIHLYGDDNEVEKTFTRTWVPWKMLKTAVKLADGLDTANLKTEDVDALTGLVVSVFGDQFSVEDLSNKADTTEMVAVLTQIVATAKGININPTPPGN